MAWSSLNPLPQPDVNFAAEVASDGTTLYIVTRFPHFYSYNPGTTNYTTLTDPPHGSSQDIGALISAVKGGLPALFFFGRNGSAFLDIFISSAWASAAPDPSSVRSQFAAGWYNGGGSDGNIFIAGGYDGSGNPLADALSYDVAANVWTTGLSPMPAPLAEVSGVWISGKFYVFGGWAGAAYIPTGYVYNPGLDSWSSVSVPFDSNSAGQPTAIDLHDGTFLLAGGYGDNASAAAWRYKPAVDTWVSVDPVPFNAYMVGASDSAGNAYIWSIDDLPGEGATLPFTAWAGPVVTPPSSCRWTFYDPHSLVTYSFEVNPNEGGSPQRKKNVLTKATSAPGGVTLMFEGADDPLTFEWSGVLLYETQLQAYKDWYNKKHQIKLTDDLGRQYMIYITSFEPKRMRSAHKPFKHSYTAKAIILDWP